MGGKQRALFLQRQIKCFSFFPKNVLVYFDFTDKILKHV